MNETRELLRLTQFHVIELNALSNDKMLRVLIESSYVELLNRIKRLEEKLGELSDTIKTNPITHGICYLPPIDND